MMIIIILFLIIVNLIYYYCPYLLLLLLVLPSAEDPNLARSSALRVHVKKGKLREKLVGSKAQEGS